MKYAIIHIHEFLYNFLFCGGGGKCFLAYLKNIPNVHVSHVHVQCSSIIVMSYDCSILMFYALLAMSTVHQNTFVLQKYSKFILGTFYFSLMSLYPKSKQALTKFHLYLTWNPMKCQLVHHVMCLKWIVHIKMNTKSITSSLNVNSIMHFVMCGIVAAMDITFTFTHVAPITRVSKQHRQAGEIVASTENKEN